MKSLDYSNRGLTFADAYIIAELMKKNTHTTKLILRQNKFGCHGAEALAGMLKKNKTLKKLNLEQNEIDYEGAAALRDALITNKSLEFLNMYMNNISDMKQAIKDTTKKRKFSLKS